MKTFIKHHAVVGQTGFTLIELLMAFTFFSFMMLIVSVGVVQVSRIYQTGVASRRTQQAARLSMEDITREVRSASDIQAATTDKLCLVNGTTIIKYERYSTGPNQDKLSKKIGGTDCDDDADPKEFLIEPTTENNNLRARIFNTAEIVDANSESASAEVTLRVTTGQEDLVSGGGCNTTAGSEFCATTEYRNTISLRSSQL